MEQIMGALADYASATADELPTLVIAEKPVVSAPAPAPVPVAPPTPTSITTPAPAPDAPPTPHIIESKDSKDDDTNVVEGEVVESDEEGAEAVDEDEGEGEVVTEADDDAVESVVEPEAEEEEAEEEEGMEVDKVVIRGRSYWMDTNSKKLYAVVGDDDVGDEVGAIVNGKAVFLAPK
jgi:hypothetical protein